MSSNYDKKPSVPVYGFKHHCWSGWADIGAILNDKIACLSNEKVVVVVDCYHGVYHEDVKSMLRNKIRHDHFFVSTDSFRSTIDISELVYPDVTDDRVFGFMTSLTIDDYFDQEQLKHLSAEIEAMTDGVVIIYGEGATRLAGTWDLLIYVDMARWEIQTRFRRNEINNLGVDNKDTDFALQYKQGYFVDWRVCDRHKQTLMDRIDFFLDTNDRENPKLVAGEAVLEGLREAIKRPFRVVPFFDPGPWGGQWMKEVCDLDRSVENFAWCFDCVPEENSLLLSYDGISVEIPAINLVFKYPRELLGDTVYARFGKEFPIRFDLLDTMDGGNLSLQVHPTTQYIREQFGMEYTQDESYYVLDARQDAHVYLGLKEGIDFQQMITDLKRAQHEGGLFVADQYVATWPVKKHDHVHIPEGTIHCSGRNCMVLEISATPYIFTFKLWDWDRKGLDGKPRPINIGHGEQVINKSRTTKWVEKNIVARVKKVAEGDGWTEEQTGLHESQFIETRRHWFTKTVWHDTQGVVNVLNLVEGKEVIVKSPSGAFEPYIIHYAETFIVPAAVGAYTVTPHGLSEGCQCATIKAYVRT